jgi:phosphate transport system protein
MATHFEDELGKVKEALLTMGSYAETAVAQAVQSVTDRNDALAEQVQTGDDIIDRYEKDIDDMAILLLAKAPLATDLRLVTVAMKISQNLERIGDEATTIARRSIKLNTEPKLPRFFDAPQMAARALDMLRDSLDAFVNRDADKARSVIPRDKDVDNLNRQIYRELCALMEESPASISRCLHLMTISKSLERVADHATNIAQEVVYLCEALDIRHEGHPPLP